MKNLFIISYGLGGGFGGATSYEVIEADNLEKANVEAWEKACEEYESYVGDYGLRSIEEIMEEENCDEDTALETYEDERESWLDYDAIPYTKENEKEVQGYHYTNTYKNITDEMI